MSRSVIKTMDRIFDYLKSFVEDDDFTLINDYQRHIKASGDEAITVDIVKRAHILEHGKEEDAPIFGFLYEGDTYLVVLREYENLFSSLSFEAITPEENVELYQSSGMLSISSKFLTLRNGVSSIEIVDRCFGFDEETKNCFDFEELCDLFQPYAVFKVGSRSFSLDYIEDFNRLVALSIIEHKEHSSLISQTPLRKFLLLESSRSLAESIINGLKSNQWEYTYLQFYQCLEYLFAINNAMELKDKYCISDISPVVDIASDNVLRKTEKDSLMGVLSKHTPTSTLDTFCRAALNYGDETSKAEKAAEYIYKIRCNLAHLRFKQDALPLQCDKTVMLNELLSLIADTYTILDEQIVSICTSKKAWVKLNNN